MNGFNDFKNYIEWRGDLSFDVSPFNEIDAAILAFISYVNISKYASDAEVFKDVVNEFFGASVDGKVKLGLFLPDYIVSLYRKLGETNRFGGLIVSDSMANIEQAKIEQFGATTYHINKDHLVVVFEGTDDSLCGWLEDIYMIKDKPVQCQLKASKYLYDIYNKYTPKTISVVGHSKGGNMAVYAAVKQDSTVQNVIDIVYDFDGPGFTDGVLSKEDADPVVDKIKNYCPDHSCVSRFFTQYGETIVCKSNQKGIMQHSLDSWNVLGTKFVNTKMSRDCIKFNKAIDAYLKDMNDKDKDDLCHAIRDVIDKLQTKSLLDLKENLIKVIPNVTFLKPKEMLQVMKFINIVITYRML